MTAHPIKHLRAKLTAVSVLLAVAVAGRLATTSVSDFLSRRPTPAVPKPPTHDTLEALENDDPHVRLRSVQILGALNFGNVHIITKFAELGGTDGDSVVRAEAVKYIIMDPQAQSMRQVLCKAIEDENHLVRRHAVMALARIGEAARPAIAQIEQLLSDPDEYVRCAAATAMHVLHTGNEPPLAVLLQMLKDDDPIIRQWAVAVLGDLRADAAIPSLREMLSAPKSTRGFDEWRKTMEGRARDEAEEALRKIDPNALLPRPKSTNDGGRLEPGE